MKALLLVIAAYHLALAGWMALAPVSFAVQVAGYPPQAPHFLGDLATYNAAFAVGLALAALRPAWRLPVLAIVAIQFVLHAVNHLLDIGETSPGYTGPVNFVLLALAAGALIVLTQRATKQG